MSKKYKCNCKTHFPLMRIFSHKLSADGAAAIRLLFDELNDEFCDEFCEEFCEEFSDEFSDEFKLLEDWLSDVP